MNAFSWGCADGYAHMLPLQLCSLLRRRRLGARWLVFLQSFFFVPLANWERDGVRKVFSLICGLWQKPFAVWVIHIAWRTITIIAVNCCEVKIIVLGRSEECCRRMIMTHYTGLMILKSEQNNSTVNNVCGFWLQIARQLEENFFLTFCHDI